MRQHLLVTRSRPLPHRGPDALSDEDLLVLILGRTGRGRATETCARDLLALLGPLRRLSTRSLRELRTVDGIGRGQALRLTASFALARRIMGERMRPGALFANPRQIFEHFHGVLRDLKREMFVVVLLDARHRILREEIVSEGSLTSS
ncbi:MAG: UPF0758 domain-containing protein, partial [Planctomycetota bacterium]